MYSQISREIQCSYSLASYHWQLTPDQVFFLNVKCHMSLELTNRDPTHMITLNIQIWLCWCCLVSGKSKLCLIVSMQTSIMSWSESGPPGPAVYLFVGIVPISPLYHGHYGQVWRDSITNITLSQSEDAIVTHLTNQKLGTLPLSPGPDTLPDYWDPCCPLAVPWLSPND